jgi:hypothetical protein
MISCVCFPFRQDAKQLGDAEKKRKKTKKQPKDIANNDYDKNENVKNYSTSSSSSSREHKNHSHLSCRPCHDHSSSLTKQKHLTVPQLDGEEVDIQQKSSIECITIDTTDGSSLVDSLLSGDDASRNVQEYESKVASREYEFGLGSLLSSEYESLSSCSDNFKDDSNSTGEKYQMKARDPQDIPGSRYDIPRSATMADHRYQRELDNKLRKIYEQACNNLKVSAVSRCQK